MNSELFESIYNEANLLQKVGQAATNVGNTMAAKANVKQAQKDEKAKQAVQAAKDNTKAAQTALQTLQAIANEQKQFDAETIKSLMDSINALNIGDDVKKNINHILNNQNAALQKNNQQTDNSQQGQGQEQQQNTEQQQQNNNAQTQDTQATDAKIGKNANAIKNILKKSGITKDEAIAWVNTFLQ